MYLQTFDESGINQIVDRYSVMVYKLAFARTRNKENAEDIFQEVFLQYIRKQPRFENETHEKAWFIRVTINCSKSLFQFLKRTIHEELEEEISAEEKPEEIMEEFLEQLSPDYRTVIHLFYYEDLSTSEISNVLGKKESTVRMQLTRARRMLKDIMEEAKENV
ncbi:MAG: RNA polymerase sigma factor [Clostridia bacterium]|nr:RNA polymerase sigma factor [Spirochaetales bacterium]MBP3285246.1 RNA polymerase sigma factor [Clostridia bacterium]